MNLLATLARQSADRPMRGTVSGALLCKLEKLRRPHSSSRVQADSSPIRAVIAGQKQDRYLRSQTSRLLASFSPRCIRFSFGDDTDQGKPIHCDRTCRH